MIVVDGRTSREKLLELLNVGSEQTELEFKATLDLTTLKDRLNFTKDCLAMANLMEGGYILVGIDDHGQIATDQAVVDPRQFESANLQNCVSRYAGAPVEVVSQVHEIDGRPIVIISVRPDRNGLPVPVGPKIGEFQDDKNAKVIVLRPGEVWVREGPQNHILQYQRWESLLARYRSRIREEAREPSDNLVRELLAVLSELKSNGSPTTVPLVLDLPDDAFADAVVAQFEANSLIQVRRVLNQALNVLSRSAPTVDEPAENALDKIAIVAVAGAMYVRPDAYELAVDHLFQAYLLAEARDVDSLTMSSDFAKASYWLQVILRCFAIGSIVVRCRAWGYLPTLVRRPVIVFERYKYGSWFRHAITQASRANLLQTDRHGSESGGVVLSLSRELMTTTSALRPDIADGQLHPLDELPADDIILNSLCQFDLLWCVIAETLHDGAQSTFYPSCAALNQRRAQAAVDLIATDTAARDLAFPGANVGEIARGLNTVLAMAVNQSHQYGGRWSGTGSSAASTFIESHMGDAQR